MYTSCQFYLLVSEPIYYGESIEKEEWQQAMIVHMNAVKKNETWKWLTYQIVRIDGLKWVYRTKYNAYGSIQKHKV